MTASESLKSGYETGAITNPRKGVTLSEEERFFIAESQHKAWESLTDEERMQRSKVQSESFAKRKDKAAFQQKGSKAIRQAAKEGSKLEKFLIEVFKENNIDYIHHYKGIFGGTNLEADFFLPEYNIVLEVDGPSHFTSVFGVNAYAKQAEADQKKNALVLKMGASIIRIVHRKALYMRDYVIIRDTIVDIINEVNNELRVINVENL